MRSIISPLESFFLYLSLSLSLNLYMNLRFSYDFSHSRFSYFFTGAEESKTAMPPQLFHGTKNSNLVLKPSFPTWFATDIEYSYQICAIAAFQEIKPGPQSDFQCSVYTYAPKPGATLSKSLNCPTTADAIQSINSIVGTTFPGPAAAMPEAKAICQHIPGGYNIKDDHANHKEEWMLCSASNHVQQQAKVTVPCKYQANGPPGAVVQTILVCPPAPCADSYTLTSGITWAKRTGVRTGC